MPSLNGADTGSDPDAKAGRLPPGLPLRESLVGQLGPRARPHSDHFCANFCARSPRLRHSRNRDSSARAAFLRISAAGRQAAVISSGPHIRYRPTAVYLPGLVVAMAFGASKAFGVGQIIRSRAHTR